MSIIDHIAELMLREGEIKAQEGRERIAAEEEQRQAKHRTLKNILKFAAQIGPMFIPGAGIVPALGRFGASSVLGNNRGFGSPDDRLQEYRSTDGY